MRLLYSCTNYQKHTYYCCRCKICQHSTCLAIENIRHRTLQFMKDPITYLKLHKTNIISWSVSIEQNILNYDAKFTLNYLIMHMLCNHMSNK